MALRRPLRVILPILVGLTLLSPTLAGAQDAAATVGDPERGKVVFQKIGYCANCHGWAGDGQAGRNPLARAKGLPPWRVLLQHALRPSSFTLITVLGLNIGGLIGGAVIAAGDVVIDGSLKGKLARLQTALAN